MDINNVRSLLRSWKKIILFVYLFTHQPSCGRIYKTVVFISSSLLVLVVHTINDNKKQYIDTYWVVSTFFITGRYSLYLQRLIMGYLRTDKFFHCIGLRTAGIIWGFFSLFLNIFLIFFCLSIYIMKERITIHSRKFSINPLIFCGAYSINSIRNYEIVLYLINFIFIGWFIYFFQSSLCPNRIRVFIVRHFQGKYIFHVLIFVYKFSHKFFFLGPEKTKLYDTSNCTKFWHIWADFTSHCTLRLPCRLRSNNGSISILRFGSILLPSQCLTQQEMK